MKTKELFENFIKCNEMIKADPGYDPPILIMLGRDSKGLPVLSISQIQEKNAFSSSKAIDVIVKNTKMGFRYDLKLVDHKYEEIFYKVVDDILFSAEGIIERNRYAKRLIERYRFWFNFWKKKNISLTNEEKQGLFGELIYINNKLDEGLDPNELLRAWRGPEMSPQDFIGKLYWAEIKTIKQSTDYVQISSLEQLDNPSGFSEEERLKVKGTLVIIKIALPSENPELSSLTSLVSKIKSKLIKFSKAYDLFEHGLELIGYDHESIKNNDFFAEAVEILEFNANAENFPKYITTDVKNAVVGMKYVLSIHGLSPWKINKD